MGNTSRTTASKTCRWHGIRWQQWLDVEARLLGKGRLLARPVPKKKKPTKYIRIAPTLSEVAAAWKNCRLLLDDVQWESWVEEWEGDIRPHTNDRSIWYRYGADLLAIVLPLEPWYGKIYELKWKPRSMAVTVGEVIMDDGPERFAIIGGPVVHLGELAFMDLEEGIAVKWADSESNARFFMRVRRQYFPDMPEIDLDYYRTRPRTHHTGNRHGYMVGRTFRSRTVSPNSTMVNWREVLEMRRQRARANFIRGWGR